MAKIVNLYDFTKKFKEKELLLFSPQDIMRVFGVSKTAATFLVYRYTKRGAITRVKRGLYVFPDAIPPEAYLANKMYDPSYISLEFALSYHRVIPETVYEITSVTPKATRHFEALGKIFTYRRIKREAFTGYSIKKQQGISFAIADPEKAFVDYTYLRTLEGKEPLRRFDKKKIDPAKAMWYAKIFGNKKVVSIVKRALL